MAFSPLFRVGDFEFVRVESGPDEGAVFVTCRRGNDPTPVATSMIDAAGWASVLAHTCRAPHDGASFEAAKAFHEAESHA